MIMRERENENKISESLFQGKMLFYSASNADIPPFLALPYNRKVYFIFAAIHLLSVSSHSLVVVYVSIS